MPYAQPARTTHAARTRRTLLVAVLVVLAAIALALDQPWSRPGIVTTGGPAQGARGAHRGALGQADGAVPDGTTVFDDAVPGVAKLDAALLGALRQAATAAAADGVELVVDSGWRSRAYQAQLLREAVATYGSEQAAARWVATPKTSAHVRGEAVDVGPPAAAAWLAEHGAAYRLCRVYGNEPWHFERRAAAIDRGCPPPYADPTADPRMGR